MTKSPLVMLVILIAALIIVIVMQVWGEESCTKCIGIIIIIFTAFCIILEISLSYLASDFYRTKINGEEIEYSGTYQITQKDGE